MGLAEHSPNNTLKVIHSELEYDQNTGDNQVAASISGSRGGGSNTNSNVNDSIFGGQSNRATPGYSLFSVTALLPEIHCPRILLFRIIFSISSEDLW